MRLDQITWTPHYKNVEISQELFSYKHRYNILRFTTERLIEAPYSFWWNGVLGIAPKQKPETVYTYKVVHRERYDVGIDVHDFLVVALPFNPWGMSALEIRCRMEEY